MSSPKNHEFVEFEGLVQEQLGFLKELGFLVIESSPEIIHFKKGGIEVEVYHERLSHEVGLGITCHGVRYSLSDVIRAVDPTAAKQFRDASATTREGILVALKEAGQLLLRYGSSVLRGDLVSCEALAIQRKKWAEEYELDVLVHQLRPKAEEAFRQSDYLKAAELYQRIHPRLSPTEIKKLALAEERSKG